MLVGVVGHFGIRSHHHNHRMLAVGHSIGVDRIGCLDSMDCSFFFTILIIILLLY
jgi:hypothetical protein